MTTVDVRFPTVGQADLADVLEKLTAHSTVRPYSDEIIEAAADISKALSRSGREFPELLALSYWMRKSELKRLAEAYFAFENDNVRLVPRGLVFHVPPANVDTIFVYSWLLSVLAGNRNIIRLSTRESPVTDAIMRVLTDVLGGSDHPWVRDNTFVVSYPRTGSHTKEISALSDMRVIWGGDNTIRTIRRSELPPHAVELTFPDRFSMSAIKASAYSELPEAERDQLADKFFNDSYWFDQMGCSSPRLVIWEGPAAEVAAVSSDFYDRVSRVVVRKNYEVGASMAMGKLAFTYGAAIDHTVTDYRPFGNQVTVLGLEELEQVRGEFCGAGFFFHLTVDQLAQVTPYLERRDQSLTAFGFGSEELLEFAEAANGRGIDRIVPFGEALNFHRFWDGQDLLQAFSRRVWVQTSRSL